MSGSSKLPASGFDVNPKICFTDAVVLPYTSTCDISITFPRSYGLLQFTEFEDKMDECILSSCGFGGP